MKLGPNHVHEALGWSREKNAFLSAYLWLHHLADFRSGQDASRSVSAPSLTMSVAASIHELDPKARTEAHTHEVQLKEEHEALELLTAVPESVQQLPLIAIDLDDVLSQTNQSVADCM